MSLAHLSADALCLIAIYIEGHDLLHLIFAGNSTLNARLVAESRWLNFTLPRFAPFPSFVVSWPKLTSLVVDMRPSHAKLPLHLKEGPILGDSVCLNLTHLHLSFLQCFNVLRQSHSLLPNLISLKLKNSGESLSEQHVLSACKFERLETLVLTSMAINLPPISSNLLYSLPRGLLNLAILGLPMTFERPKVENMGLAKELLPPGLVSLKLDYISGLEVLYYLPSNLTSAKLHFGSGPTSQFDVKDLPRSLKICMFRTTFTRGPLILSSPSDFPPNLEIWFASCKFRDREPTWNDIPRTIRQFANRPKFYLGPPFSSCNDISNAPPLLSSLAIARDSILSEPIQLPSKLTVLSNRVFPPSQHFIRALPPTLTSLIIRIPESSLIPLLPRSIKSLQLILGEEDHILDSLNGLPRSLETLELPLHHIASASLLESIPREIKSLILHVATNQGSKPQGAAASCDLLNFLPKFLRRLEVSILGNCDWEPWFQPLSMYLPTIEDLKVSFLSTRWTNGGDNDSDLQEPRLPPFFFTSLPSTLTKLAFPVSINVIHHPELFYKFPHGLKSLKLQVVPPKSTIDHSFLFSDDFFIHLPPSLLKLDIYSIHEQPGWISAIYSPNFFDKLPRGLKSLPYILVSSSQPPSQGSLQKSFKFLECDDYYDDPIYRNFNPRTLSRTTSFGKWRL